LFVIWCFLQSMDLEDAGEEFATPIPLNPTERESLRRWFAEPRRTSGI
jgi:hypothetical protein